MIEDAKLKQFFNRLPPRKREVIELVSQGLSNKEIARSLTIEPASVADNLSHIYARMELLEEFAHLKPNRAILISVFAPFFSRHPDVRSVDDRAAST